jgi:cell division protein FtsB
MTRRQSAPADLVPGQPQSRVRQSGTAIVSLILLAISCWMLANLVGQVLTGAQLERQRALAEADVGQIGLDNADLKDQVTYAESAGYVEQVAREQLGMARDEDIVILPTFPDTKAPEATPPPAPIPSPTQQPNWRGWQQALFPPSN